MKPTKFNDADDVASFMLFLAWICKLCFMVLVFVIGYETMDNNVLQVRLADYTFIVFFKLLVGLAVLLFSVSWLFSPIEYIKNWLILGAGIAIIIWYSFLLHS